MPRFLCYTKHISKKGTNKLMAKQKVLFTLAFPKKHFFKEQNGEIVDNFFYTTEGKDLKATVRQQLREVGVEGNLEYHVAYAYPLIPQILKDNPRNPERVSYKKPTISENNAYKDAYLAKIVEYDPDIIVPLSGESAKPLLGISALAKLRGQPKEVTIHDKFSYWVLPTYSSAATMVNPNNKSYQERDLNKLAKFLKEGPSAFEAVQKNYRIVPNDINEVVN